jgi:hypothetical protein
MSASRGSQSAAASPGHEPRGDGKVAREVVTFLEDRRLLTGDHGREDGWYCVKSAQEIRKQINRAITQAQPGKQLEASLRVIREAARAFVDDGGPKATEYQRDYRSFEQALWRLHDRELPQIAALVQVYELRPEQLAALLPAQARQDLSWIPGFGS